MNLVCALGNTRMIRHGLKVKELILNVHGQQTLLHMINQWHFQPPSRG